MPLNFGTYGKSHAKFVKTTSKMIESQMRNWLYALITGLLVCSAARAADKQELLVYSYHKMPPYLIHVDKQEGLYFELLSLLNQHQSDYHFSLLYVPRKRLNLMLETNTLNGVVIGVNPVWFGDRKKQKYIWSTPFMSDRDDYVSHVNKPFEYEKESSLYNKQIGGIHGFKYPNIDRLAKQGLLTRVNTDTETQLVAMVIKQRVDVAIVSELTTNYLATIYKWQNQLATSNEPQYQFERSFLVPKEHALVAQVLEKHLSSTEFMTQWQSLVAKYKKPQNDQATLNQQQN